MICRANGKVHADLVMIAYRRGKSRAHRRARLTRPSSPCPLLAIHKRVLDGRRRRCPLWPRRWRRRRSPGFVAGYRALPSLRGPRLRPIPPRSSLPLLCRSHLQLPPLRRLPRPFLPPLLSPPRIIVTHILQFLFSLHAWLWLILVWGFGYRRSHQPWICWGRCCRWIRTSRAWSWIAAASMIRRSGSSPGHRSTSSVSIIARIWAEGFSPRSVASAGI